MGDSRLFIHLIFSEDASKLNFFSLSESEIRAIVFPELAQKIISETGSHVFECMNIDPGVSKISAAEWLNLKARDRILLFENSKLRSILICTGKFQSESLTNIEIENSFNSSSSFYYTFIKEFDFKRSKKLLALENYVNTYLSVDIPFMQVEETAEENLWNKINDLANIEFSDQDMNDLVGLSHLESLDSTYLAKRRIEQTLIRKFLLNNSNVGNCFFCERLFVSDNLIAAHIKQRSFCALDERLDFKNNTALACSFGCDHLFEMGQFKVLGDGRIEISPYSLDSNASVYMQTNLSRVLKISSEMKKYFEWHATTKFKL